MLYVATGFSPSGNGLKPVATSSSAKLTAAAETLFAAERKAASVWRDAAPDEAIDATLYEDVLSLLDAAIRENPDNMHAYAFAAQVLLVKADNGDGTFDVCTLLDARDDAEYVTGHGSIAADADVASARATLKQIRRIPPSAIPDPPSSCGDDDHDHSSKTSETR
jgi:hypothetical protein